ILTGGARGIGADIVRHLAAEGATVTFFDVLDTVGAAVAEGATTNGRGSASFQHVDVTDEAAIRSAVDAAADAISGLDAVDSEMLFIAPNQGTRPGSFGPAPTRPAPALARPAAARLRSCPRHQ